MPRTHNPKQLRSAYAQLSSSTTTDFQDKSSFEARGIWPAHKAHRGPTTNPKTINQPRLKAYRPQPVFEYAHLRDGPVLLATDRRRR